MTTKPRRPDFIDMVGQTSGRWTVVEFAGYTKRGSARWTVVCSCGTRRIHDGHMIRHGRTLSCGCLKLEQFRERLISHGNAQRGKRTASYRSWARMIQRCGNPNNTHWKHYGGRGIVVCDRWHTYENFVADMGEPPTGYSIERLNVDGNYEPPNCIWANHKTQMSNTRRNAIVMLDDKHITMTDAAQKLRIGISTMYDRMRRHQITHQQVVDHYAGLRQLEDY